MTNGHRITNLVTRLLSVPADIEGGDAVAEGIPSGLRCRFAPRDFFFWVAGENLVDGGKPYFSPHLREERLVVAFGSLLASLLQVALVLAVQVAF